MFKKSESILPSSEENKKPLNPADITKQQGAGQESPQYQKNLQKDSYIQGEVSRILALVNEFTTMKPVIDANMTALQKFKQNSVFKSLSSEPCAYATNPEQVFTKTSDIISRTNSLLNLMNRQMQVLNALLKESNKIKKLIDISQNDNEDIRSKVKQIAEFYMAIDNQKNIKIEFWNLGKELALMKISGPVLEQIFVTMSDICEIKTEIDALKNKGGSQKVRQIVSLYNYAIGLFTQLRNIQVQGITSGSVNGNEIDVQNITKTINVIIKKMIIDRRKYSIDLLSELGFK